MPDGSLIQPCQATACLQAKQYQADLRKAQFDAQFADAAYTDEHHRPDIPGYVAVTDAKGLENIGLTEKYLTVPNSNFRAVVYRNLSDNTYVIAFQGQLS